MKENFLGLVAVLEKEGALCEQLLSLIKREREILTTRNPERLLESNKEKELCLSRLSICDESRDLIMRRLAGTLGVSPESLTLNSVSEMCPPALSGALKKCINWLAGLLSQIQATNTENAQLVSFSMEHVRTCISLLTNAGFSDKTYLDSGQMKALRWQGNLIDREA